MWGTRSWSTAAFAGPFVSANPARTYPRVLPASLPSVSEPDRNQGGSLVLPGLELLPVPEPLLNFELETKNGRYSYKPTVVLNWTKDFFFPFSYLKWVNRPWNRPQIFLKLYPVFQYINNILSFGRGVLETSMATPLGNRIGCNSFLLLVRGVFLILINQNIITNDYI